jgi:hypothetical protein
MKDASPCLPSSFTAAQLNWGRDLLRRGQLQLSPDNFAALLFTFNLGYNYYSVIICKLSILGCLYKTGSSDWSCSPTKHRSPHAICLIHISFPFVKRTGTCSFVVHCVLVPFPKFVFPVNFRFSLSLSAAPLEPEVRVYILISLIVLRVTVRCQVHHINCCVRRNSQCLVLFGRRHNISSNNGMTSGGTFQFLQHVTRVNAT